MSQCLRECPGCPLFDTVNAVQQTLAEEHETGTKLLEDLMATAHHEGVSLGDVTAAIYGGVQDLSEAELVQLTSNGELQHERMSILKGFKSLEEVELRTQSIRSELQADCEGAVERRRFILFGRKILKCTSSRAKNSKAIREIYGLRDIA